MRNPSLQVNDHSYEEIRSAMLDVLSGRDKSNSERPENLDTLKSAVAGIFATRENPGKTIHELFHGDWPRLSTLDSALCNEAFWNLFLERIITLGSNNANREYPFFRISHFGKAILENQRVDFFHDVSTYSGPMNLLLPLDLDGTR